MKLNLRGRWYRFWSRFIHKHGYHYMPILPVIDDPTIDSHWCQWCGLRGSKTSKYGMQKVLETLSNRTGTGKQGEPMSSLKSNTGEKE